MDVELSNIQRLGDQCNGRIGADRRLEEPDLHCRLRIVQLRRNRSQSKHPYRRRNCRRTTVARCGRDQRHACVLTGGGIFCGRVRRGRHVRERFLNRFFASLRERPELQPDLFEPSTDHHVHALA